MFTDRPTTVRRGMDRRPGEASLIDAIRRGEVEKVLLWSIDRWDGHWSSWSDFWRRAGWPAWSCGWMTRGSTRRRHNGMSLFDAGGHDGLPPAPEPRRDRILRGQAASRALSIRAGRPPIPAARVERAKQELAAGKGVRQAARMSGISAASVSRIKGAMGYCLGHRLTILLCRGRECGPRSH